MQVAELGDREVHELLNVLPFRYIRVLEARGGPNAALSEDPRSSSISAMTTFAPSSTNNSAVPRPIPFAPPVMIATFPESSLLIPVLASIRRPVGAIL